MRIIANDAGRMQAAPPSSCRIQTGPDALSPLHWAPLYMLFLLPLPNEKETPEKFKDVRLTDGSSQGQNLALTVLDVPNPLDSGEGISSDALPSITSDAPTSLPLGGGGLERERERERGGRGPHGAHCDRI